MISSVLLAAGCSSRMDGENKLVKEINGIPLIKYTIKSILGSSVNEIIVVLGYEKDVIKNVIGANKKIKFVYNDEFKNCLLYTSDAADDSLRVDLGGRRIIKKIENSA